MALDFHTRDYSFYTEFIVKWGNNGTVPYFSINPGGYNFLGVSTIDGCNGFYQWIHFEPIRLLQAIIYKLTHSIQAVFFFNSMLCCSPILAIPFFLRKTSAGFWEKVGWLAFFVAFPSTLLASGYDNRPSMFLGVAYFWQIFALLVSKNRVFQLFTFVFLFLIREEAIILNGIVCVFIFLQWRKKETPLSLVLIYSCIYVVYGGALYAYYNYWETSLFQKLSMHYTFQILGVLFLLCVGWMYYIYIKKKFQLMLFFPIAFFLFQVITMYNAKMLPDDSFSFFNDPRNSFWFICLFSLFLYVRANISKGMYVLVLFSTVLFLMVPVFYGGHLFNRVRLYNVRIIENRILKETKLQLDPTDTVITDYNTHQSFIGFNHLYCYQRLPCMVDKSSERFYPLNLKRLRDFFKAGNWVIVHSDSFKQLENDGLVNATDIKMRNAKYIVIKIKPKS